MSSIYPTLDFYTPAEERANALTHMVGLILSLGGFFFFLVDPIEPRQQLAFGVYGIGLVLSYLTSTLYHSAKEGIKKHQLRLADHASIYIHIAGSYTPYLVLSGESWISSATLVALWGVALIGACFKLFVPDMDRFETYSVLSYLAMGWFFPLLVWDVYANLPNHTLTLLIAGGLIYTGGIFFYRWESLLYNHAIWHVFVMIAAALHFAAAMRLYLYLTVA